MASLIWLIVLIAWFQSNKSKVDYDLPPHPIEHLVLSNIIGKWYEVFSSRLASNSSLDHAERYCVMYDFIEVSKARGMVKNRGSRSSIIAYEMHRAGEYKGDISVNHFHIHTTHAQPGRWVVSSHKKGNQLKQLSVIGAHPEHGTPGQYHWLAISTPLGIDLLVLARDVTEFHSRYAAYVEQLLSGQGFKFSFNKPRMTRHDEHACQYDDMWRKKEASYGGDSQPLRLLGAFKNFPDNM
eukprot:gene35296-42766_t